jgi:hypothetical protein
MTAAVVFFFAVLAGGASTDYWSINSTDTTVDSQV